ncbi:hypothetical protein [Streptomyces sp. NPDC086787]|uniref:hypothetical protein n=1 Tax=Streptomyces sp. NPDC086787 TaxID=3365759 RepID=UPI0037FCCC17
MPEHVSILQLAGAVGLLLVTAAWTILLTHAVRRTRAAAAERRSGLPLAALPPQRRTAPQEEAVELTPAEQDAFAGLMRQLGRS